MTETTKGGWTILTDTGAALPAPIAERIERWLGEADGNLAAALVIAAEEAAALEPAASSGFVRGERRWRSKPNK